MLSSLGMAAETARGQDLTCRQHVDHNQQLLSHICSHICCAFCPVAAHTMNYIASAFTSRPTSAKSVESGVSTRSMFEEATLDEPLQESCLDSNSMSVANSDAVSKGRSVSGRARSKSSFCLCHPPPVHIHKQRLHIRPRVLLQLQKVSKSSRPIPVFEVLPSVVFAPRLARHFPRTFKGKAGLGVDDLVIVTSEDYETQELQSDDADDLFDDKWDKREIIAAICQSSKDRYSYGQGEAEICLNHGTPWNASQRKNGTYEFASTDDCGNRTVARWVPKQPKSDRTTSISSTSDEKRFNFSILNPNSRRHAVIATLDRQTIDVSDQYSHPSTSMSSEASSTPTTYSSFISEQVKSPGLEASPAAGDPIKVDGALRTLIVVTGIWVAFREGFSPNFKYDQPTPGPLASPRSATGNRRRSQSLNANQFNSNQFAIPKSPSPSLSTAKRTITGLQHTGLGFTVPLSSYPTFSPPQRSVSTGTVFMQRTSTHNSSTPKAIPLSPVGDFEGSDTEKDMPLADGSPLPRSSRSSREGRDVSLEQGVAGLGLDLDESASQPTDKKTRRSSGRIGKIFGRSPKDRHL